MPAEFVQGIRQLLRSSAFSMVVVAVPVLVLVPVDKVSRPQPDRVMFAAVCKVVSSLRIKEDAMPWTAVGFVVA